MGDFKDILGAPMLLGFFIIVAWVTIKIYPLYSAHRKETRMVELANTREVQLADIAVREKDAEAKLAQAKATGGLTELLRSASEVTEELKIFLRRANEHSKATEDRMESIESDLGQLKTLIVELQGDGK